mmetsp:Transcript_42896/g.118610  ORF Transcript_42896/g.118610 Transcript_42896/m.118610 type:complete len:203 (-) Transcript_42896:3-611(-)
MDSPVQPQMRLTGFSSVGKQKHAVLARNTTPEAISSTQSRDVHQRSYAFWKRNAISIAIGSPTMSKIWRGITKCFTCLGHNAAAAAATIPEPMHVPSGRTATALSVLMGPLFPSHTSSYSRVPTSRNLPLAHVKPHTAARPPATLARNHGTSSTSRCGNARDFLDIGSLHRVSRRNRTLGTLLANKWLQPGMMTRCFNVMPI